MTDLQTRHSRGLWVILILVGVFLTLLGLIIFRSVGNRNDRAERTPDSLIVIPLRVRIRTEPGANAPVVASATSGEALALLEDRGAWVRVRTNDGLAGWAERASLERAVERERRMKRYEALRKLPRLQGLVEQRTALYSGPGIFYTPVGELTAGAKVTVYTRDHDFYAVEYHDAIAYATVDDVEVSAAGSRSLDVATTTAAPEDEPETAATATAPVPPPIDPEQAAETPPLVAEVQPEADRIGVYPVVPPGGTQPEEIDRVVPRYPAMARRANVGGAVVVRGIVRRDGSIDDVDIVKNLPYGLGDAARDAVRQWRFRPATYRGEPIDVYYTVTVNFRLR